MSYLIVFLVVCACAIFFFIYFIEQYIAEKKKKLFVVRPNDSVCHKIAERSAELNMSAEEYIIYAVEGDELNDRCRKDRPYPYRHPHDLPSGDGW